MTIHRPSALSAVPKVHAPVLGVNLGPKDGFAGLNLAKMFHVEHFVLAMIYVRVHLYTIRQMKEGERVALLSRPLGRVTRACSHTALEGAPAESVANEHPRPSKAWTGTLQLGWDAEARANRPVALPVSNAMLVYGPELLALPATCSPVPNNRYRVTWST